MNYIDLLGSTENKTYFKVLFEAGMPHTSRTNDNPSSFHQAIIKLKNYNSKYKENTELVFSDEEITAMIQEHLKNSTRFENLNVQDFTNALRSIFPREQSEPLLYKLVKEYKGMDLTTADSYISDNNATTSFYLNDYPLMFELDYPSMFDLRNVEDLIIDSFKQHCKDILDMENIFAHKIGGGHPKFDDTHPRTKVYCVSNTDQPVNPQVVFNIIKGSMKLFVENKESIFKEIQEKNYKVPAEFIENMKDLTLFHKMDAELPVNQKVEKALKI